MRPRPAPKNALVRRFRSNRRGVAAVEFALIALPLFVSLMFVFECAIQYFVWTSLDLALQRTARDIRTGQVQALRLGKEGFKQAVCREVGDLFGCSSQLLLKVDVLKNLGGMESPSALVGGETPAIEESFDPGASGDFLLVQAFLPWTAFTPVTFLGAHRTDDGSHMLRTAVLFRNEPF